MLDALLLLGAVVVVPLALPLQRRWHRGWVVAGAATGLLLGGAYALDRGGLAVALALPWALFAVAGAAAVLLRLRFRPDARDLLGVAAWGFLVVGAAWAVLDRSTWDPPPRIAPFIQLTAVHFTYGGFATSVLVARLVRRAPSRLGWTAAGATVGAPPLVAIGFSAIGWFRIVGAVVLTIGVLSLSAATLRDVVPSVRGPGAALLAVSSVTVILPMLLAVQWAVGQHTDLPALSIPDMVRTHGVANALGFTLCGVLGWRLIDA